MMQDTCNDCEKDMADPGWHWCEMGQSAMTNPTDLAIRALNEFISPA